MTKRYVILTFNENLISEPIIFMLSNEFNLITNIQQAEMSTERGWIGLEIEGTEEDIDLGLNWITSRGVRVDNATKDTINS